MYSHNKPSLDGLRRVFQSVHISAVFLGPREDIFSEWRTPNNCWGEMGDTPSFYPREDQARGKLART